MPSANLNSSKQARLAGTVQQLLDAANTPGAVAALWVEGRPVFVSGVGYRDLEETAVLTPAAQFYIYSVTKTLLAVLILQLVDEERVALDASIQTYLPDVPLETPVTVRQLLNHSGGLPDYGGMAAYNEAVRAHPTQPWTADEFLSRTLAQGMRFPPGKGWAYSNIGHLLLRLLVKAVTGNPLSVAMQERLFAPLGLQHTFVAESLADAQCLTPGFSTFFGRDESLQDVTPVYHPGWVSHGVVLSTASELALIFEALFTGHLLPPPLRAAMLEPIQVPYRHPLFKQPAYGLGVMIDAQSPYGLVAGHGGGGPGYSTAAVHFADVAGKRVTCAAFANRDQPDLGLQIAFGLVDALADFYGSETDS